MLQIDLEDYGIDVYRTDISGEISMIVNYTGKIKLKKHIKQMKANITKQDKNVMKM